MLDRRTVEALHARLLVRYGAKWLHLWADVPAEVVQADWADELDGMPKYRIEHALSTLPPDAPPNAAQFRRLCLAAPSVFDAPRLTDQRRADPEVVREVMSAINPVRRDPRDWARALRDRENAGEKLTPFQRSAWREALKGRA
jgi:hypothetical protein